MTPEVRIFKKRLAVEVNVDEDGIVLPDRLGQDLLDYSKY